MKLKELLKVIDDSESVTIHRNGQRDITRRVLYLGHDHDELLDYEVMEVASSYCPGRSSLFVWVEDPADLVNPDDLNPPFPYEVRND